MRPNLEVKQLARKFGINVKRMRIIHNGVYRIVTTDGKVYSLNRMHNNTLAELHWIDRTVRKLRHAGLPRLIWRNPKQKRGKILYVKRGKGSPPFVLHPWINGRWPSPNSKAEMRACGELLAKFHRAGKRIRTRSKGRNKIGSWPIYLKKEQRILQNAVRKAKRGGFRRPLDQLLQAHGQEILRMGRSALFELRRHNYKRLCRRMKPTICHGDFGPTNIIHTKKGLYLLDFETIRLDFRAYDLYKLIYNSCHDHGWKFSTAAAILTGYQKINKLTATDMKLLRIWLLYPRSMCKHIQNYELRPPKIKTEIERDFLKVLRSERKRIQFIKKLDRYSSAIQ